MNFRTLLIIVAMTAVGLTAVGKTISFRGGEVLAAQLSSKMPKVANMQKLNFDHSYDRKYYALVAVRMTPGRSISSHDYSLEVFGKKFPCVAIQKNNEPFDVDRHDRYNLTANDRIGMLFILDGSIAGIDNVEKLTLRCNGAGDYPATLLPFVNRRTQAFPGAGTIPPTGAFPDKE